MTELSVIGVPRVPLQARCPYCRHENVAVCRRPADHETLQYCSSCLGAFVVRFEVAVKVTVLSIQGEQDRVADEQEERLELARERKAAEATA